MAPPLKAPANEVKPIKANPSDVKPLDNIDEKRKWYSLTPDQKKAAIYSMSPEELNDKLDRLGVTGQATGISKAPEWRQWL